MSVARNSKILGGTATLVVAVAMFFISPHEGLELKAYQDIVKVWTICRGHTATARPGMIATPEQCEELFKSDVGKAFTQTYNMVLVPISVNEFVAYTSFVYNLGPGNFKKSTMLKKINRGDRIGACNELLRWKYAGKRDCSNPIMNCRGLWKRRQEERALCLK